MSASTSAFGMKPGDAFTLPGVGRGAKGQVVIDGINPATKRKCKAVAPMVYTVTAVSGAKSPNQQQKHPKHGKSRKTKRT